MSKVSWETTAQAKKINVNSLIPMEWRLTPAEIPSVSALRDVSQYIQQHLASHELEITDFAAEKTLDNIRRGIWTAVEVTRAFCHRAAIAHQLVRMLPFITTHKY